MFLWNWKTLLKLLFGILVITILEKLKHQIYAIKYNTISRFQVYTALKKKKITVMSQQKYVII